MAEVQVVVRVVVGQLAGVQVVTNQVVGTQAVDQMAGAQVLDQVAGIQVVFDRGSSGEGSGG